MEYQIRLLFGFLLVPCVKQRITPRFVNCTETVNHKFSSKRDPTFCSETTGISLPRKIWWDGEFPQEGFCAPGNLAPFAPALRGAANRAEAEYEFPMEADDPTRRVLGHFLSHRDTHSAQIDTDFLRFDSHGRAHARSQSCSNEISRRKGFAFTFIIGRRVSGNL